MADKDDPKYPVGYKKPPRQTQFKPGQSGNPKGRRKGSKNFGTVFAEELRTPIEVTEHGKRKRISKRQAIVKQAVNKAVTGDPKATAVVLNEARFHESQNQFSGPQDVIVSPEDQKVMDNLLRRIWQSYQPVPDPQPPSEPPTEDQSKLPPQPKQGES
ncbi:MAG: DUF5681 domain-containing protein [Candidatus Korobacteraceae bacterium]|jgi:hypothetical protein